MRFLRGLAVGGILAACILSASGAERLGAQEGREPYALIKGSVFTDLGRSFPGVRVQIERIDVEEEDVREDSRREGISDNIGEFAFRIPPGPARWELTLRAEGYRAATREIEVYGDERVDITVLLQPDR